MTLGLVKRRLGIPVAALLTVVLGSVGLASPAQGRVGGADSAHRASGAQAEPKATAGRTDRLIHVLKDKRHF